MSTVFSADPRGRRGSDGGLFLGVLCTGQALVGMPPEAVLVMHRAARSAAREVASRVVRLRAETPATLLTDDMVSECSAALRAVATSPLPPRQTTEDCLGALAACGALAVRALLVVSKSQRSSRWAFDAFASRLEFALDIGPRTAAALKDARERIKTDKLEFNESLSDDVRRGIMDLRQFQTVDEQLLADYSFSPGLEAAPDAANEPESSEYNDEYVEDNHRGWD
jgi:hypothetical protein